jgi:hypothetical protein
VAAHPEDAMVVFAQRGGTEWVRSADGGATWTALGFLTGAPVGATAVQGRQWADAHRAENKAAAPVSRIAVAAGDETAHGTQLALGTDRVWYTDDSLRRWITLPTSSDPFDGAHPTAPDRAQDRRKGRVLQTVWGAPDRLYVLADDEVVRISRDAAGAWSQLVLYDRTLVRRNWKGKVPHGLVPETLPMRVLAVHRPDAGHGTLYLGTDGPADEPHLWWFDGDHTWLPTGLDLDSPVHAVAVDPDDPAVVYVGTDFGVRRGAGTFPAGGEPSWTWTHASGNLPEAPCVDLLATPSRPAPAGTPAGPRLLRAALAGRGVWELPRGGAPQGPQVFLRSHAYDDRRVTVDPGGPRDPFGSAPTRARHQVRLDASPDVTVVREQLAAPVVGPQPPPPPPPEAGPLPIGARSHPYDIWRVLTALRAAGADVDPEAGWSPASAAAYAARAAVVAPPPASPRQVWRAVLQGNPFAFDQNPPDHADLALRFRAEPDRWPKDATAATASSGHSAVYVTVHSRHWTPVPANTVRVALLLTPYGRRPNLTGTAPLPAGWAAQLGTDSRAPLPLNPAWLGASWSYADPDRPFRVVTGVLGPRHPQTVRFDVVFAGLPWDVPGHLLLAVTLADNDPLVTAETNVAALVRGNHRLAARSVRNSRVPAEAAAFYPGLDISRYPTQARMRSVWNNSNFVWTGLYLDSPFPDPAQAPTNEVAGHNPNGNHPPPNAADAWMRSWPELRPMWGIAPIYWGQQDPRANDGPDDLRPRLAVANAQDAYTKSVAANLPPGTVVYLDYEMSGAPVADGRAYIEIFARRLAELGYRPGLYCFPAVSAAMRAELPNLYSWDVRFAEPVGAPAVKPWRVRNGQLTVDTTPPVTTPADPDTILRQWQHDTQLDDDGVPPPEPDKRLRDETGAVVPNPALPGFLPDLDAASVYDPAFPERRNRPDLIRVGRVAVTSGVAPARAAITAVRRGRLARSAWSAAGAIAAETMLPAATPHRWNPFSPVAAVKPAAGTEIVVGLACTETEGDAVWRVQAVRQPAAGVWRHETVPDSGLVLDPLPGVTAVNRRAAGTQTPGTEVYAVDDATGTVAGAARDPAGGAWTILAPLTPATRPVRRTNRPAAVSRAAGVVDLVTVATDGRVWVSHSPSAGQWDAPAQISGAVRVHPLANVVAVSAAPDRIDVLFIGAGLDPVPPWWPALGPNPADLPADGPWSLPQNPWRLYDLAWTAAGGWAAAVVAGGTAVGLDPLITIGAHSRRPGQIDVYASGLDNRLYTTGFTNGTWSVLGEVLRPAPAIASIDGVVSTGQDDVEIVVTGRDGNVYATHWDTTAAVYSPLATMRLDLA